MSDDRTERRATTAAGETTRLRAVESEHGDEPRSTAYPWHALPEVSREHARVINRLLRLVPTNAGTMTDAVTRRWTSATGLEHALRWRGLRVWRASECPWPLDGGHISRIEWPGVGGVGAVALGREPIDGWLEALLEDGWHLPQVPAPLTPRESGLVTYLLCCARQELVNDGGPPVELSVEPPEGDLLRRLIDRADGAVELAWSLQVGDATGLCRVVLPLSWVHKLESIERFESAEADDRWETADRVSIDCPVTVGRSRVTRRAWATATPGAVVVVGEHGMSADLAGVADGGGSARLWLGDSDFLEGELRAVRGDEFWQFQLQSRKFVVENETNKSERTSDGIDSGDAVEERAYEDGPAPTTLLERPALELEVCIGQATLRFDELRALKKGSVVELSARAGEPVEVRVNGDPVADGELVTIEGQLGVRILRRR